MRPALILALTVLAASQAAAGVSSAGPPLLKVDGWALSGEGRSFGPANLYEYVDGAAELYLSLGFQSLWVGEYADGRGGSAVVEIYRHESPVHAFGIYAQECPREGNYLRIGAEGYLAPPYLNFLIGDAYVKLSADGVEGRTEEILRAFAEATVSRLGGEARLPSALGLFPKDGKVPRSERFAARDFLGYEFLRSGFAADYVAEGQRFRLFVIQASVPGEAREMLRRYLEGAGLPTDNLREGVHVVADKYNGQVAVLWKGGSLGGVVGLAGGPLRERYLRMLDDAIVRQP
jgi:hypothetical protein